MSGRRRLHTKNGKLYSPVAVWYFGNGNGFPEPPSGGPDPNNQMMFGWSPVKAPDGTGPRC
jgi:hypothetical protein